MLVDLKNIRGDSVEEKIRNVLKILPKPGVLEQITVYAFGVAAGTNTLISVEVEHLLDAEFTESTENVFVYDHNGDKV